MDSIYILESKEYFQKFNIIISYFFIILDFIFYIIISLILKSKSNSISLLKYKFYILLITDIIYLISFIKTYFLITSFSKELLLTLLPSCQFYIILSFLQDISNKIKSSENNFEKLYPFRKSTYFFFLIFPYEKFAHGFIQIIFLCENLVILGGLFKIYGYLRNKVYEITLVLRNIKQKNEFIFTLLEYKTVNPLIFFSFYYVMNIVSIFVENPINCIYLNILLIIVKELGKYLIFVLLGLIIYSLEKYLFNYEKSNKTIYIGDIE